MDLYKLQGEGGICDWALKKKKKCGFLWASRIPHWKTWDKSKEGETSQYFGMP